MVPIGGNEGGRLAKIDFIRQSRQPQPMRRTATTLRIAKGLQPLWQSVFLKNIMRSLQFSICKHICQSSAGVRPCCTAGFTIELHSVRLIAGGGDGGAQKRIRGGDDIRPCAPAGAYGLLMVTDEALLCSVCGRARAHRHQQLSVRGALPRRLQRQSHCSTSFGVWGLGS